MIKAIITDIEGTITRISFVKDILFPYAAKHLPDFVKDQQDAPQVSEQIDAIKAHLQSTGITEPGIDQVVEQLLKWIEADEKITPLKQLQGLVWQHGYRNGDFTGHLYPDAYEALCELKAQCELYVYSSGSVKAQQLLFEFSDYGDIRHLFKGYFDTRTGAKKEAAAYAKIAQEIGHAASDCLFLSDVVEELDAAKQAGMQTCQLYRDDQAFSDEHVKITDFTQLNLEQF